MVFGMLKSRRNDDVVIAGNGITEQGIKAVVDALKASHGIEVLNVSCLYWMYACIVTCLVLKLYGHNIHT